MLVYQKFICQLIQIDNFNNYFPPHLQYPIKNSQLLVKCGITLVFIITMFFLQSIPEFEKLSIGWCALIGVMLLLIIADK